MTAVNKLVYQKRMWGPETDFLLAMGDRAEARSIEHALRSMGYFNFTRVDEGLAALGLVELRPLYFILAAWDLSGMWGIGLLDEVRHNRRTRHLPFVLVGSPPAPEALLQARSMGVNGFLYSGAAEETIAKRISQIMTGLGDGAIWPDALERGEELLDQGRLEEGIASCELAAEEVRRRASALGTELGTLLAEEGNLEEAEQHLRQAVADDPNRARAHAALGRVLLAAGRPAEAVVSLERARMMAPCDLETEFCLTESLTRAGQPARAETVCKEMLARGLDPHAFNRLAIAFRRQGLMEQAIGLYLKVLEKVTDDEHLLFNLARCLVEAGRPAQAMEALSRAIALNPGFIEARKLLLDLGGAGRDSKNAR